MFCIQSKSVAYYSWLIWVFPLVLINFPFIISVSMMRGTQILKASSQTKIFSKRLKIDFLKRNLPLSKGTALTSLFFGSGLFFQFLFFCCFFPPRTEPSNFIRHQSYLIAFLLQNLHSTNIASTLDFISPGSNA